MNEPNVVLMSLWRNDEGRKVSERIGHLLGKTYPNLRWVWVVGDSTDKTEMVLRAAAELEPRIEIVRYDSEIEGNDPDTRLRRLSLTANAGLDCVREGDDYWVIHESDIVTPNDLIERFLATEKCPIAGWPMYKSMFYDTWAYRQNGVKFSNAQVRPEGLIEMDSVGTCWMFHAEDLRSGVRASTGAAVELCNKLRELGRHIWVDPSIEVRQPADLMVPHEHSKTI